MIEDSCSGPVMGKQKQKAKSSLNIFCMFLTPCSVHLCWKLTLLFCQPVQQLGMTCLRL